ncbi:hypothetical protein L7F22_043762 [Adiantum nelumboides]|nr:hypothetical protein [Adiantum nelumboides]
MATNDKENDDLTSNNDLPQSPTGSTTLRSIVERIEPSLVQEVIEVRKTPFGNVRVVSNPKEGNEGQKEEKQTLEITITNPHFAFFDQQRIASLTVTPIKQRTKYGRAELWPDGKIVYHHSRTQCTLSINSNGSTAILLDNSDIPLIDPVTFKKLSNLASSWFTRFRQILTIAQFIIPSNEIFASSICHVRANGPEPDFVIQYARHQSVSELKEEIYVRISRQRNRLVYNTKVGRQEDNNGKPWTWRYGSIPLIRGKVNIHKWSLDLSGTQGTPHLLSEHEFFAIQQALKMTEKVDSIYRISFDHIT